MELEFPLRFSQKPVNGFCFETEAFRILASTTCLKIQFDTQSGLFSFPTKILYVSLLSRAHPTCSAQLIRLDFIILVILG